MNTGESSASDPEVELRQMPVGRSFSSLGSRTSYSTGHSSRSGSNSLIYGEKKGWCCACCTLPVCAFVTLGCMIALVAGWLINSLWRESDFLCSFFPETCCPTCARYETKLYDCSEKTPGRDNVFCQVFLPDDEIFPEFPPRFSIRGEFKGLFTASDYAWSGAGLEDDFDFMWAVKMAMQKSLNYPFYVLKDVVEANEDVNSNPDS